MLINYQAALGETLPHFVDWTIQHRQNPNYLLAWHCGDAPVCLARNSQEIALRSRNDMKGTLSIKETDPMAGLYQFQLRPGKVTFCRLAEYDAALQAAKWMREAGKKVSIDCAKTDGRPISKDFVALISYVDILICGSGFGYSLTGHADIWKAGEAMLSMGLRIVVQTEGKDGSYTVTREERFHTPAFVVDVVDTTGAGDVFHGAYLMGLLHGWDLKTVAYFATHRRFSAQVYQIRETEWYPEL
jgi:sugar/nucleoside kinase (ribokinase family)